MNEISRQDKIRSAIEALRDKHGRITAQRLVRAARSFKHPLHNEFEWDDRKAAAANRIDRANELIRFVTVVTVSKNERIVTPFYVRDPAMKGNEPGMIAITSDLIDRVSAEKIMLAELERCESSIKRARTVVGQLDKGHRGLSLRLEQMLAAIVETRELLAA